MKNKKIYILYMVLLALLFTVIVMSVRNGSVTMTMTEFLGGILKKDGFFTETVIIYSLRLPRIFAGFLAGIGLSVSGVLLQNITNNPLCGPNIIGVNAGAGFAVILCLSLFPSSLFALPIAAFFGAFLTTLLITAIAHKAGRSKNTVVLAGIACTTVYQAGISFMSMLDTDVLVSYNSFSIGGLSGAGMNKLYFPAVILVLCFAASLILSREISVLCLGDSLASALGVRVRAVRLLCLLLASASAAAVVSYAGLLGFVGLIVPHISRKMAGEGILRQLLCAPLVGGIIVILADLCGRIIAPPSEIPVGILMSLIGAPFFFFLLLRRRDNEL